MDPIIVWFRQDLRLTDNPALSAPCERGAPVVPLCIWSPAEGEWLPGCGADAAPNFRILNLGADYPLPIGDHNRAQHRTLAGWEQTQRQ
ncbi:MAG: deoxyribodipyrimidine photo-lyase [Chromatiales bacterium]